MGAKRKQNKPSSDQLYTRAQRALENGNAKEALKGAKVCYRAKATPEHRQLLERAYLSRAQQLRGLRLVAEASAVLDELAALGATDPEVSKQLVRLQVLQGKGDAKTEQLLADDPSLRLLLTDEAVLDPQSVPPSDPQMRKHIAQIREALACVERGADDAVGPLLQDIPRSSPLGDWKLLIRGLSAFYQRDQERTEENWRRLDPTRAAWRIARTLSAAADPLQTEDIPPEIDTARRRLIQRLQDASLVSSIKQLSDQWQQGDLRQFMREFRSLRQLRAKTHAKLIESIVDMVWKRAVRDDDQVLLSDLIRIGPAPPLDPRWNRAKMLMMRGDMSYDELDAFERHGMDYADDLLGAGSLPPTERAIAAALACQYLARSLILIAAEHRRKYPGYAESDPERADLPWLKAAVRAYRKSISHYGRLESAYLELASVHSKMDEDHKSAVVLEKLVDVNPDNCEARSRLAHYYLGQDEPGKSEQHVEAAVRLQPRDERTVTLRWCQRVAMIRCLAQQRQFAAAEQELEKAMSAVPDDLEPYTVPLIRTGLALKAKQADAAQQHLSAALDTIEEPTAIWLQMTQIAARYKLPEALRKDYDRRYKKVMENEPTGPTAGRLARIFTILRRSQTNYTGRVTQERLFLKYLHRATLERFAENDLRDVCQFLFVLDNGDWQLKTKFVTCGVQRFPDCARLQLLAGELEMERGPFLCNSAQAREHMQRAFELVQDSRRAADVNIAERAQRALTLLSGMAPAQNRMRPFTDNEDEECDCPACRAERADRDAGRSVESDEYDDHDNGDDEYCGIHEDYGVDEGDELEGLLGPQGAEFLSVLAGLEDQMPPNIRDMFRELIQGGPNIPQPEFSKKNRKQSSDRGAKRRR